MALLLRKVSANQSLLAAARFAVVGMLGTLVDFSLFFAAQMLLNLPTAAASALSYSAGIANNYYFHRNWTFAARPQRLPPRLPRRQFALFAAVSLAALAINSAVVAALQPLLLHRLPDPALAALLAKIFATAAGLCWNFAANSRWTFRAQPGTRRLSSQ